MYPKKKKNLFISKPYLLKKNEMFYYITIEFYAADITYFDVRFATGIVCTNGLFSSVLPEWRLVGKRNP